MTTARMGPYPNTLAESTENAPPDLTPINWLTLCTNCALIEVFCAMGLAIERKQIPRFVVNASS